MDTVKQLGSLVSVVGSYIAFRTIEAVHVVGSTVLPEKVQRQVDRAVLKLGAGVSPRTTRSAHAKVQSVKIVVVGGGYAGIATAKELERRILGLDLSNNLTGTIKVEIVLVERRDVFFHCVGCIRALSDATIAEKLLIPYDDLFLGTQEAPLVRSNGVCTVEVAGQVLTGMDVTKVGEHTLECNLLPWTNSTQSTLTFDWLVITTGSSQHEPWKFSNTPTQVTPSRRITSIFSELRQAVLTKSACIVVIGGGAVGIEVASELALCVHAARVVMIEAGPTLLSALPSEYDSLKVACLKRLEQAGVEVWLNERCKLDKSDFQHLDYDKNRVIFKEPTLIVTESGKQVLANVKFMCIGNSNNSQSIQLLDADAVVGPGKEVNVAPTLQLACTTADGKLRYPHIFSAGDITSTNKPKLVIHAGLEATLVAKNLSTLLSRRLRGESLDNAGLTEFPRHIPAGALVMLGKGGAILLPVVGTLSGKIGDFLSWLAKSRDGMVGVFRASLNAS